jgi:hypothetical protein
MQQCVAEVQAISAVPDIMNTLAALTGLRMICVAHVTETTWTACAVMDQLNYGLKPGDPLDVTTTLCEDVRDTGMAIVIDSVDDSPVYREHPTRSCTASRAIFRCPCSAPAAPISGRCAGSIRIRHR